MHFSILKHPLWCWWPTRDDHHKPHCSSSRNSAHTAYTVITSNARTRSNASSPLSFALRFGWPLNIDKQTLSTASFNSLINWIYGQLFCSKIAWRSPENHKIARIYRKLSVRHSTEHWACSCSSDSWRLKTVRRVTNKQSPRLYISVGGVKRNAMSVMGLSFRPHTVIAAVCHWKLAASERKNVIYGDDIIISNEKEKEKKTKKKKSKRRDDENDERKRRRRRNKKSCWMIVSSSHCSFEMSGFNYRGRDATRTSNKSERNRLTISIKW